MSSCRLQKVYTSSLDLVFLQTKYIRLEDCKNLLETKLKYFLQNLYRLDVFYKNLLFIKIYPKVL